MRHRKHRASFCEVAALVLLVAASCGDGDEKDEDPGDAGRIIGTVFSPNGDGIDVVPGARLTLNNGQTAVADSFGQFRFDDVQAGEGLTLAVEGPDDLDATERFGTTEMPLRVQRGQTTMVAPHLLRGCRAMVDGAAGGTAGMDRCAGAGGVSVTFEAGSFATTTGSTFDDAVRIEMTALDPDSPGDVAGLPPDGADFAGPTIWGGAEVRLLAADTGELLALADGARATLRFEVPELPSGVGEEDLVLEFYDPTAGQWVEEGDGSVVSEDGRHYFEASVTHFTTYRATTGPLPPTQTCMLVVPRVCQPGQTCEPVCPESEDCDDGESVQVLLTDVTGRRPPQLEALRPNGLTGRACIRVPQERTFLATFFYVDSDTGASGRRGPYLISSSSCRDPDSCSSGVPSTCDPSACTNLCDRNDRGGACVLDIHPRRSGCASGTFLDAAGDPVWGPVHMFVEGDRIGSFELPRPDTCETGSTDCRGNFCIEIPLQLAENDTEISLWDSVGNAASFVPRASATAEGNMCPRTRPLPCGICDGTTDQSGAPAPVSGCQAIDGDSNQTGRQPLRGTCQVQPINGQCLHAGFTYTVDENTAMCPPPDDPDKRFEVTLDAGSSTGDIAFFEWFVDGALVAQRDEAERELGICLGPGSHPVELAAVPSGRGQWLVLRAREEQTIVLGRLPCASTGARIPADPDAALSCLYDHDGLAPSRDCERGDGSRALFVYSDEPCGFPCFTGNPLSYLNLWSFDPVPRALSEQNVSSADEPAMFARTEYTLDGLGNVTTAASYAPDGSPTQTLTYTYDNPAQPALVTASEGADVVSTFNLTWSEGRLTSFEISNTTSLLQQALFTYHYDDQGRLTSIDWEEVNNNPKNEVFVYTHAADSTTIEHQDANGTALSTISYQYVCP